MTTSTEKSWKKAQIRKMKDALTFLTKGVSLPKVQKVPTPVERSTMTEEKNIYKVKEFLDSNHCPFTKGQWKHFLLHRKENGLDQAVAKIGKCIYVDKERFKQWFEGHFKEKQDV